jgi:tetratricopeptide (TPR) repeat protein
MECPRCGHHNVSSFRFCEACLAPLKTSAEAKGDVVSQFFDDADILEVGQTDASRGSLQPAHFDLPWQPDAEHLVLAGRDIELQATIDPINAALGKHTLGAQVLLGEMGSGRSRLMAAVREKLQALHPGCRCLAFSAQGGLRPFGTIERLLRLRFDIPDYLAGTIAGERFERSVEAFYGDAAGAEVARTCGPMLGFRFWQDHAIDFEDSAEQARRAREALYNLLARDLTGTPTVLLIDDAGEADAESLDLLQQLQADKLDASGVLLLATDRRGVVRHGWLNGLPRVELHPLDDLAMTRIAQQALAGVRGVDEAALTVLIQHANGRPGTLLDEVEQLARTGAIRRDGTASAWTLEAGKIDELAARGGLVTGRGVRLGGLTDFQLQVLSLGAVFGQRFWSGAVVGLLRQDDAVGVRSVQELDRDDTPQTVRKALHALAERGLVLPERQGGLAGETAYRFVEEQDRLSLLELHDAATLATLSQRAAIWLQMVGSNDLAEVLANLWLKAGDPVHAAHLYLRAGERALAEFRAADAKAHLEQARSLVPADYTHVHWAAAMGLGKLAEADGRWQEAEAAWRDALELSWRFRARGRGAQALLRLGRMYRAQGKLQPSFEHLAAALKLFEAVGDMAGLASTCDDIGRGYWTTGRTQQAVLFLQRAAQLRESIGDRQSLGHTLTTLGLVSLSLGQVEQARNYLDKAVKLQRERKHLVGQYDALNAQGILHVNLGEVDAAVQCMEEAADLARRVGNRRMIAVNQNNLGEVLMLAGRLEDGEALLYKAVEGAGRLGDAALLSDAARNLAVAARRRDDRERALKWAKRSVAAAQQSDVVRTKAASQRTLAEVLSDAADVKGAHDAYDRAEHWLEQAGDVQELQTTRQAHAAFLARVGRAELAQQVLARAVTAPPDA